MSYYFQFISAYLMFEILITLVLILSIVILVKYALRRRKYSKLLPSRCQRFIDVLGDLHALTKKEISSAEYPLNYCILKKVRAFSVLFEKEKLFCTWFGYHPVIFLHKPESIEELIETKISKKPFVYEWARVIVGNGLITSHGKKWKSHRKLFNSTAFNSSNLKELQPIFNKRAMNLVNILQKEVDNEFTDVIMPLSLCSLDIVCDAIFGINMNVQENNDSEFVKKYSSVLEKMLKRIFNPMGWFDVVWLYLSQSGIQARKEIKFLKEFTTKLIQEKENAMMLKSSRINEMGKGASFLDLLMHHFLVTRGLTEEEVQDELLTFSLASHDTTSAALIWTLHYIGYHQHVLDKIHEELDEIFGMNTDRAVEFDDLKDLNYLECVIKESMRLCPPLPIFGRKAGKDVKLCGYPIPEGATLFIVPYSLHRNKEIYPNPELFDPLRFTPENTSKRPPYTFIPFSIGPRNCIGQIFAMMEMKTVLANILRNFTVKSLDSPEVLLHCIDLILRPSGPVRMEIRSRVQIN